MTKIEIEEIDDIDDDDIGARTEVGSSDPWDRVWGRIGTGTNAACGPGERGGGGGGGDEVASRGRVSEDR